MKKLKSFILLLTLVWIGTSKISAQSAAKEVSRTSEIYQKLEGNDKWRLIGKCDSNLIYENRNRRNKWTIVGKWNDSLIYQKRLGKDKWKIVGKYNEGLIYQKRLGRDRWKLIGKYGDCPGAAGFLLLLSNDGNDTSAIVVF